MKVLEVKWEDAWIDTEDFSLKDAKELKPVVRSTVALLFKSKLFFNKTRKLT